MRNTGFTRHQNKSYDSKNNEFSQNSDRFQTLYGAAAVTFNQNRHNNILDESMNTEETQNMRQSQIPPVLINSSSLNN